nr:hypothetical protein [Tanacetum cinerariifolium]
MLHGGYFEYWKAGLVVLGKFMQEHCLFCHHQIGEDCWELYDLMIQKKQKNETRGTKDEDFQKGNCITIDQDLLMIVKKQLVLEIFVDESLEMIMDESLDMVVDESLMVEDKSLKKLVDETLKLDEEHFKSVIVDCKLSHSC